MNRTLFAGVQLEAKLRDLLDGKKLILTVTVVSPWRLFRHNVGPKEFEEFVSESGPDYTLAVSEDRARRLVQAFLSAAPVESKDVVPTFDARYRATVAGNGTSPVIFYLDAHGRVLHEGKIWKPSKGDDWLEMAVAIVEQDISLSKGPPF